MTLDRRTVLARLGVGAAGLVLAACRPRTAGAPAGPAADLEPTDVDTGNAIRARLHDLVGRLRASYADARATMVVRAHTISAVDVHGAAFARARHAAVLAVVRDRAGHTHELMTTAVDDDGLRALAIALADRAVGRPLGVPAEPVAFDAGPAPTRATMRVAGRDPRRAGDDTLRARVDALLAGERPSRIVYAAAALELDDTSIWTVGTRRDLAQRLVRVRETATRVAWNEVGPVIGEVGTAWRGGLDRGGLDRDHLARATGAALEVMTPAPIPAAEAAVALAPDVTAALCDRVVRALLLAPQQRRPEVAARVAIGGTLGGAALAIADDPTGAAAYGGLFFDDDGEPAVAVPLLDGGRVTATLARVARPGHLGLATVAPSHLRVAPGTLARDALVGTGYVLEGPRRIVVDARADRIEIEVARAREVRATQPTGRVFADVVLTGSLALLATVAGASQETGQLAWRDERDRLPTWRSIEAPWLAARGLVRPRGGQAT